MTGRARDMILDPDQTDRLREVIAEGEYYGMQTFDQALLHHYKAGRVSMEDAVAAASSQHDFKLLVAGDGRTATSMEDLGGAERRDETPAPAPTPEPEHRPVAPMAPMAPAAPAPAPAMPIGSGNGRSSAPPPGFAA